MSDTPETDDLARGNHVVPTEWEQRFERDETRARVELIKPHKNNPVAEYFSSSNTPETDALVLKKQPFGGTDYEWIELSRRLERERNEARKAIHIAESLIKPQIEREQLTPEARPDNDEQRDLTALLRLLREVRRERDEAREDAHHNAAMANANAAECCRAWRERNEAREALENHAASTIHTCHDKCKRPMCVLRRERDEAREEVAHWKTEYLIVAARLCGEKHPRDNGIISEHEIIPKLERERDNWEQTAADYLEGMHYYRGLVQEIGETIGEAAYLQDDGGKVDSVLCAKVPELVEELKRERDELKKIVEQRILVGAEIHDKANSLLKQSNRTEAECETLRKQLTAATSALRQIHLEVGDWIRSTIIVEE